MLNTEISVDPDEYWDVVVVGTGMGGATLGYLLAKAGWRVLFCEKGFSSLENPASVRGVYAEDTRAWQGNGNKDDTLRLAGRCADKIVDWSGKKENSFVPFMGCGTGGSSGLYGMVLERFFPEDFSPRANFPTATDSTLPDHWPIGYGVFETYYEKAERLFGVTRDAGTLSARPNCDRGLSSVPLCTQSRQIAEMLTGQGLHPYRLPLACANVAECLGCQGFLCERGWKQDSARACLEPALKEHGAKILDQCEVVEVEADGDRVTGLVCLRHGRQLRIRGRIIVLAAGALATSQLLLASGSERWPGGVANDSGLVGRNLMRHFVDLYALFPSTRAPVEGNTKDLGCNDFYLDQDGKFGTLQSFGRMPPATVMVSDIQRDLRQTGIPMIDSVFGLMKPLLRPLLDGIFSRATVMATIMEDLPYAENRVVFSGGDRRSGIKFSYRVQPHDAERIARLRGKVRNLFKPIRHVLIKQAENNQRIAHVCGTCRFGDDPRSSVLDRNNRAHGVDNLYVVDGSFFPSSGGTNPALTIAANAIRVAEHLVDGKLLEPVT